MTTKEQEGVLRQQLDTLEELVDHPVVGAQARTICKQYVKRMGTVFSDDVRYMGFIKFYDDAIRGLKKKAGIK